ncbi:MAG: HEAT repeat domain-containing protein, partial [Bdellovibrionales bacterium]|nr:HEAT repeat domain-containing protein [Bdellovibrionales bacterium]
IRDSNLLEILIDTDNPQVVRTIVTKFSELLGLGTLLRLLDSRDKDVRIEAIRALKGFNDLGAMRIIVQHYESERDAVVRGVYKETFWFIQRREDDKSSDPGL